MKTKYGDIWNNKPQDRGKKFLKRFLFDFGYANSSADVRLFIYNKIGTLLYMLYVDETILTSKNQLT